MEGLDTLSKKFYCVDFWMCFHLNMMSKESHPPEKGLEKRLRLQMGFIVLLGVLLALQFIQLLRIQAHMGDLNAMNAERGLELDGGIFDGFKGGEGDEDSLNALSPLLFSFVEELGSYEANRLRYEANVSVLRDKMKAQDWASYGLKLREVEGSFGDASLDFTLLGVEGGEVLLVLSLSYDGIVSVRTYHSALELKEEESAELSFQDLLTFCSKELSAMKEGVLKANLARGTLQAFIQTEPVQTILSAKKLSVQAELEQSEHYSVVLTNVEGAPVAEFKISKLTQSITLESLMPAQLIEANLSAPDLTLGASQVLALLDQVDARTNLEKKNDALEQELGEIFADPAFVHTLETLGFRMGEAVETEASLEYPLLDAQGSVLRRFVLDKSTGTVKVSLPDGNGAQELSYATQLLEATGKKKLSTHLL
jgi:hypothetical protein